MQTVTSEISGASRRQGVLQATLLALIALCSAPAVYAELLAAKLSELVRQSGVILYGDIVPATPTGSESDASIVWLTPQEVLKGSIPKGSHNLPVCNAIDDPESPDLRSHPGSYVIFAKPKARCYQPIWGATSLVFVRTGIAYTLAIQGEPEKQSVSDLLKRIRTLVPPETHSDK